MKQGRTAQRVGLLSLPDELLTKVALNTCEGNDKQLRHWAKAASTCKQLFGLQLYSKRIDATVRKWQSLKWHLKRNQQARSIHIHVEDWPEQDEKLQELSVSLTEFSCSLQQLKRVKFGPLVEERTVKLLSPWISCMLSGASSLEHADIGVELLQCLPASRRKALRSLYVRACFKLDARAEPDIQQAVMDCQQLRSLAIICNFHDWSFHQLDLRNLVHLRSCRLKLLPAPAQGVFLAQGETELTIDLGHVTAWSKLWPQLQNSVHSMRVEGYPYLSGRTLPTARLQGWPEGLDAFHGLQVLHMFCREFRPYWSEGSLDLAHLAYIPHVSLHCKGDLDVKISKGTWKILKLQSTKAFALAISDPTAFMAGTEFFSFVFSCKNRPHAVIEELEKVGDETGATLYEYHDKCHSKHVTSKKHDFHLVKFSNREVNERSNENFVSISMEGTRSWKRQLGFEATMGTSQSRPGGAPRGAPPGFERPSPQAVPPLDRQESLRSQTDSSAAVSAPGAVPDLPTQADNSIAVSAPGEKE